MLTYKVIATDPDVIFRIVRNVGTVAMDPGYGVMYAYRSDGQDANDGVGVRFCEDNFTTGYARVLFAGLVVGRRIYPGAYGTIQCWGPAINDPIVVFDTSVTAPPKLDLSTAILTDGDLAERLWLEPAATYYSDHTGAFVILQRASASIDFSPYPALFPVDAIVPAGATTYGTLAHSSTGTVKAFIRCL